MSIMSILVPRKCMATNFNDSTVMFNG